MHQYFSFTVGSATKSLTMCDQLFACGTPGRELVSHSLRDTPTFQGQRTTCTAAGALCPGVSIGCALCGVFSPGTCGQQCIIAGIYFKSTLGEGWFLKDKCSKFQVYIVDWVPTPAKPKLLPRTPQMLLKQGWWRSSTRECTMTEFGRTLQARDTKTTSSSSSSGATGSRRWDRLKL